MRSIYDFVPVPMAHYMMNDILATDVIIDETGDHPGAVKDPGGTATSAFHAVAGKINRGQDLDGGDDYIEIADHADFTPAGTPFSISAWVYMHDVISFIIVTKGIYNTNGEWWFITDGTGKLQFYVFDESVDNCYVGRMYDTALTAYQNMWVHLVATYDGGALTSGIKLYLNGVQIDDIDCESATFVAIEAGGYAVRVGRYASSYANGLIDDLRFFDVALTARQVMKLADFRGKESVYNLRPNKIYHTNINNKNGIFGGVKEGCIA